MSRLEFGITPMRGYRKWDVRGGRLVSCYNQVWPLRAPAQAACTRCSRAGLPIPSGTRHGHLAGEGCGLHAWSALEHVERQYELSDTALEIMVDALQRCPSPMSGLGIVPYLGAVSRIDATATAFAHRAPGYSLLIVSQWQDPRETEPNISWAKESFEALQPYVAGRSYVNNLTADDGRMVHSVWGANYQRLVTIKRRYDPGNIFRLNHNIDPSAQEAAGRAPRKHIHAPCRKQP